MISSFLLRLSSWRCCCLGLSVSHVVSLRSTASLAMSHRFLLLSSWRCCLSFCPNAPWLSRWTKGYPTRTTPSTTPTWSWTEGSSRSPPSPETASRPRPAAPCRPTQARVACTGFGSSLRVKCAACYVCCVLLVLGAVLLLLIMLVISAPKQIIGGADDGGVHP